MKSPTPSAKRKESAYSKRITKSNPLIHNRDDGRETRRKLFLKRVRQGSEAKRWEARGGDDEMMRSIWLSEERRRVERIAREASYLPASQDEEEEEPEHGELQTALVGNSQNTDEDMANEVAQREDAEIEALLAMMEAEDDNNNNTQADQRYSTDMPYGSDDEEYDHLFMEVINEEDDRVRAQQKPPDMENTLYDQDVMDMS